MKNCYLVTRIAFMVLVCFCTDAYAQIHPLAFSPNNWYQNYVGMRFEVTAPSIIAGNKMNSPAMVGTGAGEWPDIVYTPIINTQVVMPPPSDSEGATPFAAGSMTGKICLIWRGPVTGSVQFAQKAIYAQNAGAVACVIMNEYPGGAPFPPGYVSGFGTITIPVIMIGNDDANAIEYQYNLSPGSVRMTISFWGQGYNNDLGFVPGGIAGWHDFAIPSKQLYPGGTSSAYKGIFGSFIANYGAHNATNVKVKDTLRYTPSGLGATVIHTGVSPNISVFHPYDSIYAMTGGAEYDFAPTVAGNGRFDLKYTIASDTADQYPGDNSATYSFYTTDSVYSKGAYDLINNKPVSTINYALSTPSDFLWGPTYYVAHPGSAISSVQFSISSGTVGPLGLGSMNIYAFQWIDGSGGQPLDGYVQNGELNLVSTGVYNFLGTDSSGGVFKVRMGDPITGTPGSPIVLDSLSWYYIAAEVPSGYFLGCDGNTNVSPYPRIYSHFHNTTSLEYSNFVWPGDYSSLVSNPASAESPCAFPGPVTYINSVDSFNFFSQKGLIPSVAMIVNNNPWVIAGPDSICAGSSLAYTHPVTGGNWTSTNPAIATVGLTTGIVSGISAGVVTIKYASVAGQTTRTITVNPLPAPIGGAAGLCAGATLPLTDITAGGSWSSSGPSIATIGSSSGIVSGISAGITHITYSLATGCSVTTNVTVNPLPAAITGPTDICTGANGTLSDASTGGTWVSSNTAVATIGSATGVSSGVATGTTVITYSLPTGCIATTAITVDIPPSAGVISGIDSVCPGDTVILTESSPGGVWSSSNATVGTVSSAGVVAGISTGTVNISYAVTNSCATVDTFVSFIVLSATACPSYVSTSNFIPAAMNVFPNPGNGMFTFTLTGNSADLVTVVITNMLGEKVLEFQTTTNKTDNIRLTAPDGIYFVTAATEHGKWMTKIVLNHR